MVNQLSAYEAYSIGTRMIQALDKLNTWFQNLKTWFIYCYGIDDTFFMADHLCLGHYIGQQRNPFTTSFPEAHHRFWKSPPHTKKSGVGNDVFLGC
ncbi:hypothetical protein A3860_26935 [Niastella vici]|uniref:Uncharacterized protein n=1 Tax=Niastella vici TaxID=1703345 RepID=A0A1V9FWA4_9BACT|nr:hypothetical protein A3860_26935 [Niastella vici]